MSAAQCKAARRKIRNDPRYRNKNKKGGKHLLATRGLKK